MNIDCLENPVLEVGMKKLWVYSLVVTALLVGNSLPRHWFMSPAEAAPADVFGSPNVAVDTYRNVKGTYVLWSDGRITNADGASTDLGRPYRDPDAAAKIGKPPLSQGRPLGSPNVAVKAIPRSDATFILFSDGTIRRPANADAAAGEASGSRVVAGTVGMQTPAETDDYIFRPNTSVSGGTVTQVIQLKKSVGSSSEANGVVYMDLAGSKTCLPLAGQVSADGTTVSFSYLAGAAPPANNTFQFLIVAKD